MGGPQVMGGPQAVGAIVQESRAELMGRKILGSWGIYDDY